MGAGTWLNGKWLCAEYLYSGVGGNLYEVSPDSGKMTIIGNLNMNFNGLAFDETTSTLFGVTDTALYSINPSTAGTTLIGYTGISNTIFINLACNSNGQLFSANVTNDQLYSINKTNGTATPVGPLGINISYSQDMEFDQSNDTLYLTGMIYRPGNTYQGNLYTVNTATGAATLKETFQNEAPAYRACPYPTIQRGTTFTGSGNWSDNSKWNKGAPGSNSYATISGDVTIDKDASCYRLTVNSKKSVILPASKTLAVNGTLLLKSDTSGSATFVHQGLFYSPNSVSIERYISPNAWHLVSSPVSDARASVFAGAWHDGL